VQFLYAKQFPSDVRKVYGASSNVEGCAHYCEQIRLTVRPAQAPGQNLLPLLVV
jgi:hypothetical protein